MTVRIWTNDRYQGNNQVVDVGQWRGGRFELDAANPIAEMLWNRVSWEGIYLTNTETAELEWEVSSMSFHGPGAYSEGGRLEVKCVPRSTVLRGYLRQLDLI